MPRLRDESIYRRVSLRMHADEKVFFVPPHLWMRPEFGALWANRVEVGRVAEAVLARRRREFGGSRGRQLWTEVVARDGEHCAGCGWTNGRGDRYRRGLTLDHVIPLSRGGANVAVNLQILCAHCNAVKGDTMPRPPEGLA